MFIPLGIRTILPMDHVKHICKVGQEKACCRYLVCSRAGFECAKLDEDLKMTHRNKPYFKSAQGDNCPGKLTES